MKKTINILLSVCFLYTTVNCNKKYDEPPVNEFPEGVLVNISDLKDLYDENTITIENNYVITGVITTEETNGNFYKESFLQDQSAGIHLKLNNAGGLYIGDSVKIHVQGLTLTDYGDMIQIQDLDIEQNVLKIATEKIIVPYNVTINNLNMIKDPCKLIQISNVEFTDTNSSYADGISLTTGENEISDCNGNTITLRTSGYANFANNRLASGNGNIIGIFTKFGDEKQLLIRDINEIQLNNQRCDGSGGGTGGGGTGGGGNVILTKDFDDLSITSSGWMTFKTVGNTDWEADEHNGDKFAKITNYSAGSNSESECWLISPAIDLSSYSTPTLSFKTIMKFAGDPLTLLISDNYDGSSNPTNQGTWNNITNNATWDSDDTDWGDWIPSGDLSLSNYSTSGVYIAFKYNGSSSDGSTWEVDDIIITE